MNEGLIIRKVRPSEVNHLMKIGRITFAESFGEMNTESNLNQYLEAKFNEEQLSSELKNPESHFYFAEWNSSLIGYLKVNFGKAQTEDVIKNGLEIERIYILASYQGKGLGQRLLDKAIAQAREMNFYKIWLGVWDQNEGAIRFYQRNGFREFAKHPFILGDEEQTDLLMEKDL